MNVTISVPAKFHAFRLAEQLHQREALSRIYTSYPRFKLDTKLPRRRVKPFRYVELVKQLGRVPGVGSVLPTTSWSRRLFDGAVARNLRAREGGIFVGFSGSALASLKRANRLEQTTVVERVSTHIRTQNRLLGEEYNRHNRAESPIDPGYIQREEAEYVEANYVVTPSKLVYSSFIEQGIPSEKVICQSPGVDPRKYTPATAQDDIVRFLFAGRIGLRKGVQYLLDAWDMLNHEEAELLLAGKIEPDAKPLIKRHLDCENVQFLGWVDDMEEVYQKSSVLVHPAIEDGFAYVVLEAMASGLPVIVSENTGAKDCVRAGATGLLVPAGESEALADAMRRLADAQGKRREMGKAARADVKANYTWSHYGDQIYDVYRSIVH